MSERDQEIIASLRSTYEALSRGDFDAAIEIADPDIELVTIGSAVIFRGADQVRAWMEPETMENVAFEPEHFEVAGNSVLVRQIIRGRGVASGINVEMDSWAVWTISEAGLATRIQGFRDDEEDKAREAAGLAE